jgi:tetratricopeptide (TPR) repeat protein
VALAQELAAKSPNDKKAQLTVASIYVEADQPEKASAIFDQLRAKGMLTDNSDYETGYRLLANMTGKGKETAAFINEGLDKKILTPTATVYSVLGQAYYDMDQIPQAIAAWEKGAPMAKDGEMYLNIAKLHSQVDQFAAAKASAHQALDKGLERPGEAWLEIARAETEAGNKAGIIAAYREAAKDPKTRAQANQALKHYGAK